MEQRFEEAARLKELEEAAKRKADAEEKARLEEYYKEKDKREAASEIAA